jgi:tubulin-folding cofactor B
VSERRLPGDLPLQSVKGRLELLCGVPVASQKLSLWTTRTDDTESKATQVAILDDDAKTLQAAGAQDGMGLLLTDTRGEAERDQFGEEEAAKVNKYEMDDETYSQRAGKLSGSER